jgi:signal transduction histidine kinase
MRRRLAFYSLRARLVVAVALGAVLALSGATLAFNLLLRHQLRSDANAALRSRAAASLATLSTVNGHLRVGEAPDAAAPDSPTWVYGLGGRVLEAPPAASRLDDSAAALLARGPQRYREVPATDTLLYSVPVVAGGLPVGAVVVGASLSPYERTARDALIGSLALAAIMLLAMLVAARLLIGRALAPVDRMTAAAGRFSHDDLDRRLVAEGDDEIARLARTLNSFLDRLAANMRRERRFSAELSHELRTPLSHLLAELELAEQEEHTEAGRATLAAIRTSARRLERTLETVLSAVRAEAARADAMSAEPEIGAAARGEATSSVDGRAEDGRVPANGDSADVRAAAAHAVEAAQASAVRRGVEVTLQAGPDGVRAATSAEVIERILAPVLENGVRHAASSVSIEVDGGDGRVALLVRDDGAGVAPADREHIFEPGVRRPAAAASADEPRGAGLGLPLARRLARAAGGEVDCLPADPGDGTGAVFRVRLPLAASFVP